MAIGTKTELEIQSSVIVPLILDCADVEALLPTMPEIVGIVMETFRQSAAGQVDSPTNFGDFPKRPFSFLHASHSSAVNVTMPCHE